MNRLIGVAVLALIFTGTSAHAEGGYFSGNLGLSSASDSDISFAGTNLGSISFDPGFNIGVALGHDFGNGRAEFEIAYHYWAMDTATLSGAFAGCPCTGSVDGDASALSFMVNGYYDFHITDSNLAPYLGVGVGLASIVYDIGGYTEGTGILAYQLMAGVGYDISPKAALTLGYRYFTGADAEFDDGTEVSVQAHEFNVGIRFKF